jgi:hypothetical protein
MKKIFTILSIFISLFVYSQNITVENGTYIANEKGQKIRLILKDNQYDLSLMSGKFELKKDSILLSSKEENESNFELIYKYSEVKSDIIKINLQSYVYNFEKIYLATYNKDQTPNYKRIVDFLGDNLKNPEDEISNDFAKFEINRADFLVLVKEDYTLVSEISKFKLPQNVSEIIIIEKTNRSKNLKLSGIYNQESKELTISENGRNPLVFKLENKKENALKEEVIPFETLKINNWSYSGKEISETANPAFDAAKDAVNSVASDESIKPKFQLIVENNLKTAISSNAKTPKKFLVVYYDPKNKNAKSDFDNFFTEQNTQLNYNMYSEYDQKYDLFNYYFGTKQDEKWLKTNKIKKFPCVVTVNSSGEIVSQSNKSIFDLQNQFYYYDDFGKKLNRINALMNFKKAVSKPSNDSEVLQSFAEVSALEIPYEEKNLAVEPVTLDAVKFVPPQIVKDIEPLKGYENIKEEVKVDPNSEVVTEKIEEAPMVTETIHEDVKPDFNEYTKVNFDKKQIQLAWKNLIQNHKNDSKPNLDLTLVIIKELKNIGFTKQTINEKRIIDTVNEQAFEYLFKHFDAIEEARIKSTYNVDPIHDIDLLATEIKNILNIQIRLIKLDTPIETQQKIVAFYKRLINLDKSSPTLNEDYFDLLKTIAINTKSDKQFVQEYDEFFDKTFDKKNNLIETLDNLYNLQKDAGYESWSEFKNSFSNSANNSAWYVVENSKNPQSIKKAIKWSENSLQITKNNHYYLDTLAQLYYLNGEKEKAFATEQLAIDNNILEPENVDGYRITLEKMKNGTY